MLLYACLICNKVVSSGEALIVFRGINSDNMFTAEGIEGLIHIQCLKEIFSNKKHLTFPVTFKIGD